MIILLTKYCRKRRKNEKYKKFSKSDLTSVTALPCLHLFEWSANRWTERRDKNHGGDSSSAVRSSALDGCFCPRLYSSSEVRMCDARGAGQPTFETNERRAHGCDGRSLRALDYDDTGRKKNNRTAHFGSVSRAGRARRTRGGKPRMNRGMTERVWSWNEKKKTELKVFHAFLVFDDDLATNSVEIEERGISGHLAWKKKRINTANGNKVWDVFAFFMAMFIEFML